MRMSEKCCNNNNNNNHSDNPLTSCSTDEGKNEYRFFYIAYNFLQNGTPLLKCSLFIPTITWAVFSRQVNERKKCNLYSYSPFCKRKSLCVSCFGKEIIQKRKEKSTAAELILFYLHTYFSLLLVNQRDLWRKALKDETTN